MLKLITESCQYLLKNFPPAEDCKDYLNSRLSVNSQNLFQFGYFPPIKYIDSLINLVGNDTLLNMKLFYSKCIEDSMCQRSVYYNYFENHPLILPFKNVYGDIVAIVGRSLLSDVSRKQFNIAKYKNTVFPKGDHLFGLFENKYNISNQDFVYVVEGQIDVIKSMEIGLNNIVALGGSTMTYKQLSLILRYTNNIFLLLDNDDAGYKGRKNIIDKFGNYANIHNFYIPDHYNDIDKYISSEKISDYKDLSLIIKN